MNKAEINCKIINLFRLRIEALGLGSTLALFPIENCFTRRPRFWRKDGIHYFSVFMWQLNELDADSLEQAINTRIASARAYFGI